jgi:tetraacyldisaccharide 4'-kinase
MSTQAWFNRVWYEEAAPRWWLVPFSLIYGAICAVRRMSYRRGWRARVRIERPVVVIGNLSVGGTGKTPLVMWLSARLRAGGRKPGIVTRGYAGKLRGVHLVAPTADAALVGDEPLLLARGTGVPVAVGVQRPAAAQLLVDAGCDVILCDDGLQHYALERDCELAVVDAERRFGNGWLLPAGPLREPPERLETVQAVIFNAGGVSSADPATAAAAALPASAAGYPATLPLLRMRLDASHAVALRDGARKPLTGFAGRTVHALAAIGNPQGFFQMLRGFGITVIEHALPDHAALGAADLVFDDEHPVLMTEKDAVKCGTWIDARHWSVPVEVRFLGADGRALLEIVVKCIDAARREPSAALRLPTR